MAGEGSCEVPISAQEQPSPSPNPSSSPMSTEPQTPNPSSNQEPTSPTSQHAPGNDGTVRIGVGNTSSSDIIIEVTDNLVTRGRNQVHLGSDNHAAGANTGFISGNMANCDDLRIGVNNYSSGGNNHIQVYNNDFRGFRSVQIGVGNYARGSNTIIVGGPWPPSGPPISSGGPSRPQLPGAPSSPRPPAAPSRPQQPSAPSPPCPPSGFGPSSSYDDRNAITRPLPPYRPGSLYYSNGAYYASSIPELRMRRDFNTPPFGNHPH